MEPISYVVAVAMGVGFLYIFYSAIRVRWPAAYFGASDLSSYAISLTPLRFFAYRFVPVYGTCLAGAVVADRAGGDATAVAMLIAAIHGSLTLARSLFIWWRSERALRRHRTPIALVRLAMLVLVVAAGLAAAATHELSQPFVPSLRELTASLWTAGLAAIAGAYVANVSRSGGDEYELANRSISSIPPPLWALARSSAADASADERLVLAVMVVENLQRPSWFRQLERAKGKIPRFGRGTYGIMQMLADRPLGDEESIRLAAIKLKDVRVRVQDEWGETVDTEALRAFARIYNPSSNFADLLEIAYVAVEGRLADQSPLP